MRPRMYVLNVLFAVGLLAMAGIAMVAPEAMAGTSISPDAASITNQVHHKLAMLPWYGVFDNLTYEVNGTEVTLTGQLVSEHGATESDAVNAVKRIPGVTNVIDKIEVLPPSVFDAQIRRAEY